MWSSAFIGLVYLLLQDKPVVDMRPQLWNILLLFLQLHIQLTIKCTASEQNMYSIQECKMAIVCIVDTAWNTQCTSWWAYVWAQTSTHTCHASSENRKCRPVAQAQWAAVSTLHLWDREKHTSVHITHGQHSHTSVHKTYESNHWSLDSTVLSLLALISRE